MKIVTLVGTRPEIIRLSVVIKTLQDHCDHLLVHTGQNYDRELNEIFFDDLEIQKPDHYLEAARNGPASTIAAVIEHFDKILAAENPDALLILGDTNSAYGAIAAKKRKIPIFHYEAGNRCFDNNVPEEVNRKIIDHLSDLNITYSQIAKSNLLREGLAEDRIICLGSPMFEVIQKYRSKIDQSDIISKLNLEQNHFFILSAHREENIEDNYFLENLLLAATRISDRFGLKCIFSVHPRTQKKLESNDKMISETNIEFMKPFNFTDYCKLQMCARFVASDSGTISEESSILGFNGINLRTTNERQEMNEVSPLIMTGRTFQGIYAAMEIASSTTNHKSKVADYHKRNIAENIRNIIYSYTQYINYYSWRK